MIPHAPSDATFASLVVGLAIGLSFAIGSYIALTQSWTEQLSVVVELLRAHSVLTWAALAAAGAAFVRVGCRTWQEEVELSVEERLASIKRNIAHLPARFPNGWYKLCDSSEIELASTKHVALLNKDVALFRAAGDHETGSGRGVVHVLDAFCPHLGANLGHEGKVDGNSIECPFHGWQFDPNGVCNKIPYASKIPNTAKTGVWECCEVNGSVFLWYDVDRRKPSWSIPSLSSGAAPTNGGSFHGRIKRHIPGNVLEVMTKQADAWSGDLISQAPTSVSPPSVCGFAWRWSRGKSEWVLSAESPNEATLTTSAQLTFLGRVVPFASFTVTLRHIGPSLVYATFQPASVVGRTLLGDVLLTQTCRPDSAFLNSVEWTVNTRPLLGAGAIATAAHLVSLPVRRAVAKLMLRLVDAEFAARILPIYTLRTRRLGLHNSAGARDAFAALDEEEENASEAAEAAAATDRVSPTAKLSSRAAVSPVSSSAAAASASRPRTSVKGYSTTSHFAVAFWRTFYSDSAAKKQDDLTW